MACSLVAGRTLLLRIPCCDFRQTLLASSEAQEREAYGPNAREAEFVICDQPIDITYIRIVGGWLYLVAFLDWHSRYIVSWELDQSLAEGFVLAALDR